MRIHSRKGRRAAPVMVGWWPASGVCYSECRATGGPPARTLEAGTGFEPVSTALQAAASPLGQPAIVVVADRRVREGHHPSRLLFWLPMGRLYRAAAISPAQPASRNRATPIN